MPELDRLLADLLSVDETRAEAAASALATHGPEALPALLGLLEDADPDRRWWAARGLAAVGGAKAVDGLIRALQDPAPAVRQCAALGLRERPSIESLPALVRSLEDPDRLTARLAGDALAAAGREATATLIHALQSPSAGARIEAARALAIIGDESAVPALGVALDDPSAMVQYWAEEAFERMGLGMVYFSP